MKNLIALVIAVAATCTPLLVAAEASSTTADASPVAATAGDPARGKHLFNHYCIVCHGAGGGGGIGPSLKGLSNRLSAQDVVKQLTNPRAAMPKFSPGPLSDQDVRDVAAYVLAL
ncbi:c-type cytochrome [Trinickia sp. EG282A]|uniref:c-type cytochrome n=1 Tax=Trinickia sp. EG282A TaxID=3237013 RepID=UPI0034D32786